MHFAAKESYPPHSWLNRQDHDCATSALDEQAPPFQLQVVRRYATTLLRSTLPSSQQCLLRMLRDSESAWVFAVTSVDLQVVSSSRIQGQEFVPMDGNSRGLLTGFINVIERLVEVALGIWSCRELRVLLNPEM